MIDVYPLLDRAISDAVCGVKPISIYFIFMQDWAASNVLIFLGRKMYVSVNWLLIHSTYNTKETSHQYQPATYRMFYSNRNGLDAKYWISFASSYDILCK